MDNLKYGPTFFGSSSAVRNLLDDRHRRQGSPLLVSAAAPPRQLKLSQSATTLIPLLPTPKVE